MILPGTHLFAIDNKREHLASSNDFHGIYMRLPAALFKLFAKIFAPELTPGGCGIFTIIIFPKLVLTTSVIKDLESVELINLWFARRVLDSCV